MLPKVTQILSQKIFLLSVVKKFFVNIVVIERVGVFFVRVRYITLFLKGLPPWVYKYITHGLQDVLKELPPVLSPGSLYCDTYREVRGIFHCSFLAILSNTKCLVRLDKISFFHRSNFTKL